MTDDTRCPNYPGCHGARGHSGKCDNGMVTASAVVQSAHGIKIRVDNMGNFIAFGDEAKASEPEPERKYFGSLVTDFRSIRRRMKEMGID
jgi:hypothetical protein